MLLNQRNRILRDETVENPKEQDFTPEAIRIAAIAKTQYSALRAEGFDEETAVYLTAKLLANLI